jgi:hypothetical protein
LLCGSQQMEGKWRTVVASAAEGQDNLERAKAYVGGVMGWGGVKKKGRKGPLRRWVSRGRSVQQQGSDDCWLILRCRIGMLMWCQRQLGL